MSQRKQGVASRSPWVLLVVAFFVSVACWGATYNSVEELPEPDALLVDRVGDEVCAPGGCESRMGWCDIREVRGYLVDGGIAFAVVCSGRIPEDEGLLVFLDVEGEGGAFGRGADGIMGWDAWDGFDDAGYDFALGYSWGRIGAFDMSSRYVQGVMEHWTESDVAYFEVSWELLGGEREAVAFLVLAQSAVFEPTMKTTLDLAPSRGVAVLENPQAEE